MTVLDVEALAGECEATIARLRAEVASMALDALSDPAVRDDLAEREAQLAEAQAELERLGLASAEQERRESARLASEDLDRRQAAVARAHELQAERKAAAKRIDRAVGQLVRAVGEYVTASSGQQAAFTEAGMPHAVAAAAPRGFRVEGAFARALRDSDVGLRGIGLWDRLPMLPMAQQAPIAETDVDMSGWQLPAERGTD